MIKGASETNYSSSYTTFAPFNASVAADVAFPAKGNLTYGTSTITAGDRTLEVWGIIIGENINTVRVSCAVRYKNGDSSGCNLHTYLGNGFGGDGVNKINPIRGLASNYINGDGYITQNINTIMDVQEGDFLYLYAYKASASKNIDVLADDYPYAATYMCVEAIG